MRGVVDVAQLRKSLGDQLLFVVERKYNGEDDPKNTVVYTAERKGNVLAGVSFEWVNCHNPAQREAVSDGARDMFYGVVVHKMDNKPGLYRMKCTCFEDRLVDLQLKKAKGASPGAVIAKVVINKKRCRLDKVYVDLTVSGLNATLNEMWLCGTFNGQPQEERIPITQAMTDRIDVTAFLTSQLL